jgi:protocatechuate 3,4-dioxygenase beta subunit
MTDKCWRVGWVSAAVLALCSSGLAQHHPPPPFGIRGTVLDVGRKPVPGADVRLLLENPHGAKLADTATTDELGRFATRGWIVSGSDDEGDWRIEVSAPGLATSVVDDLPAGVGSTDIGPVFLFEPVTVTGTVLDALGEPIEGAEIHSMPGSGTWSHVDADQKRPECTTDAGGRFEFRSLPPGPMTLGVSAPKHADFSTQLTLKADAANEVKARLALERWLGGVVRNEAGAPIAGAVVEFSSDAFWRSSVVTSEYGRFELRGLRPSWAPKWTVKALGYVPVTFDRFPVGAETVVLKRSWSFVIRAERDGVGSAPEIKEFRLYDKSPGFGFKCGVCTWSTTTPRDPTIIEVLSPSAWRVYLQAMLHNPDVLPPLGVSIRVTDGCWVESDAVLFDGDGPPWGSLGTEREVLFRVPPTGAIQGAVLRSGDKSPVAGTTVMTNHWSVTQPDLITTTDDLGKFRSEGLWPCDLHDVAVRNEDWMGTLEGFTVVGGETTSDLELIVAPPPAVAGRVSIDGHIPGEPVVLGLGSIIDGKVYAPGWNGFGITNPEGDYRMLPFNWGARLAVIPKRPTDPAMGGYRRFRSEFPEALPDDWPWVVGPVWGEERFDFDLERK